jgi:hypothetical protein
LESGARDLAPFDVWTWICCHTVANLPEAARSDRSTMANSLHAHLVKSTELIDQLVAVSVFMRSHSCLPTETIVCRLVFGLFLCTPCGLRLSDDFAQITFGALMLFVWPTLLVVLALVSVKLEGYNIDMVLVFIPFCEDLSIYMPTNLFGLMQRLPSRCIVISCVCLFAGILDAFLPVAAFGLMIAACVVDDDDDREPLAAGAVVVAVVFVCFFAAQIMPSVSERKNGSFDFSGFLLPLIVLAFLASFAMCTLSCVAWSQSRESEFEDIYENDVTGCKQCCGCRRTQTQRQMTSVIPGARAPTMIGHVLRRDPSEEPGVDLN